MKKQRAIIVTGMHRSGTSAIASIFVKLGFNAGKENDLLKPDEHNKYGYYENKEVVAVNDDILLKSALSKHSAITDYRCHTSSDDINELGWLFGSWLKQKDVTIDNNERKKIEKIIRKLNSSCENNSNIVIKDPRFSFTLPLWKEYLEKPAIILMIRHPAAVAKSLWSRDRIYNTLAYTLWYNYTYSALNNSIEQQVYILDYDKLILSPDESLLSLVYWLNKHGFSINETDIVDISKNIKSEENHYKQIYDKSMPEYILTLYEDILTKHPDLIASKILDASNVNLTCNIESALYILTRKTMENVKYKLEKELDEKNSKLSRIINHPVVGPVIRILRFLKQDSTFGKLE